MSGGLRAALACVLAAVAVGLTACGDDAPTGPAEGTKTLTIYSSLPLEGTSRQQSQDMVNACKLALQQAGGQVGPLAINYVSLDSATRDKQRWTNDQVLDNARQAVKDPNAIAYIGDLDSAATALSLPLLNEAGILQISPSSTYVGLTRAGTSHKGEPERFYPSGRRTFGRVVPADDVQARALLRYMRSSGVHKLYTLDDRDLYGDGLVEQLQRAASDAGIKIVDSKGVNGNAKDFTDKARKVAESGADAFFYGGGTDHGAAKVYAAVAGADPHMKLFAPDAVAEESFTTALTPAAADQLRITTPALPQRALPAGAMAFRRAFRAHFGRVPQAYAIYAYDAMQAALRAVRGAGRFGNRRPSVVKAFFAMGQRPSVLGPTTIDRNGDTSARAYAGRRVEGRRLLFDRMLDGS